MINCNLLIKLQKIVKPTTVTSYLEYHQGLSWELKFINALDIRSLGLGKEFDLSHVIIFSCSNPK